MISYIKGILTDKDRDMIVVEAANVGYGIYVPVSVLELLPPLGKEVQIYTYLQVREDDLSLFGFLARPDLEMFKRLISVTGIGPKGALGILSALRPEELRLAILTGDAKAIARAPGVGAKTAQRLIRDLKDKVKADETLQLLPGAPAGKEASPSVSGEAAREAVDALVALGYTNLEAVKAVRSVEMTKDMDAEAVLKASLKYLAFL